MASHLCVLAKQRWCMAVLQRWSIAYAQQRTFERTHHKKRRVFGAWTGTRFSWRKLRLRTVLPRVFDQCQRMVIRSSGKYNQASVEVLPVRGGERVQVVRLYLRRQRKNRCCYSISLLSSQLSGMILLSDLRHLVFNLFFQKWPV